MQLQFISDLHLTADRPSVVSAFCQYLDSKARQADTLYILGDFFDYWLGDDAMSSFHREVASSLRAFSDSGRRLFFMVGNRDFLIGERFMHEIGATALNDPCTIDIDGRTVVLTHGDLLCTDDVQYQRYRRIIQHPLTHTLANNIPVSLRRWIVHQIVSGSRKTKKKKTLEIMDVSENSVVEMMRLHQTDTLIHGHTHRPNRHPVELGHTVGERLVLGDWERQGWVLLAENGQFKLDCFDIA